jgi:hypothetical protein
MGGQIMGYDLNLDYEYLSPHTGKKAHLLEVSEREDMSSFFPYVYDRNLRSLYFETDEALKILTRNEITFFYEEDDGKIGVSVCCSDVFAWSRADIEPIKYSDIRPIFDHYMIDRIRGVDVWCIKNRGYYPQRPVREQISEEGIWDLVSINLKENPFERK